VVKRPLVPRERLQKILASGGIASRRGAEALITAGRVTVDGRVVTELGSQADPEQNRIEVDGRPVAREPFVYLVFHKPRNVVSTMSDPAGRPTVAEYVTRVGARVVPVGRLDFGTTGTLLLTNDGDFSLALLHPRKESPKIYVAEVEGVVEDRDLLRWRQSIDIGGRPTRPAEVTRLGVERGTTLLRIVLREGKNRQIHRLGEATGFPVRKLSRLSFAGITDDDLRPGQWRHLTVGELQRLRREYGVPRQITAPPAGERSQPSRRQSSRGAPSSDRSSRRQEREHRRGPADPPPARGPNRRR
jgi:23S rRNA pseudouridine2605 synthase